MSTKRMIEIYHGDDTYYGQIGTIEATSLGSLSHGIMSAYLSVRGDGWGISVGGYCLDIPVKRDGKFAHREGTGYGLDHVMRLIETVGAESWEDCVGKNIIVLFNSSIGLGEKALGIANISDEAKVMIFSDHTERRRRKDGLPDKRYTCPVGDQIHYWILDNQNDERLELIEFFTEVGLIPPK